MLGVNKQDTHKLSTDEFYKNRTAFIDHLVTNVGTLTRRGRFYNLGQARLTDVASKFGIPTGQALAITEAVHSTALWLKP